MPKMIVPPAVAGLLLFVVSPAAVSAETTLTPVVVTATRTPQQMDETMAAVTVITREDIERSQSRDLIDLLSTVPGIDAAASGGRGKFGSVFIRGTNSSHAVVLVDGVRIGSVTDNRESLEFLAPELIERVEIVRGPLSSLYGSDAVGGVIQIFTRAGQSGLQPRFSLGGGAHGGRDLSGGLGGGDDRTRYNLHFSHTETQGFDACDAFSACFATEPDNDAYRNSAYSARLSHRLAEGLILAVNALVAEGETEFDGGFSNETDFRQQIIGTSLDWQVNDAWRTLLQLGESRDERQDAGGFGGRSHFDTRREQLVWQNDLAVGDAHLVTLGYEYLDDELESSTGYAGDARDNHGLFAQLQTGLGGHLFRAAVRHDDNEQFGGHLTGSLGWGYLAASGLRWSASVGTGFQAPSFNDLYFPGLSDPSLDPEESLSYEVAVARREHWGGWEARGFVTEIEDLIVFDLTTFLPVNVGEARIRGVELQADTRLRGWEVRGSVSLLNPEDRDTGNLLARRSEQLLQLDADRVFGRVRVGASLRAQGRRFDDPANTRRVGGFGRLDLRGEVDLKRGWKLRGRLENALDNDYETAAGFNTDNTALFVSIDYTPSSR